MIYRLPPKTYRQETKDRLRQKLTVMLRYRRKNTVKIWFTVYRQNVTVKKGKTVYRQKVTVMLRYRPVQVRQKYRYRTPPWYFVRARRTSFLHGGDVLFT